MIGDQSGENAAEPGGEFDLGRAAEAVESLVGYDEGILHNVRGIGLPLQATPDLRSCQ
jgi:hypothetical protein